MTVIALKQAEPEFSDVVGTLRRIADSIEAGEYDFPVTTGVVVIGHSDRKRLDDETFAERTNWETFGFGPRCDPFTVRGVLLSAAMLRDAA